MSQVASATSGVVAAILRRWRPTISPGRLRQATEATNKPILSSKYRLNLNHTPLPLRDGLVGYSHQSNGRCPCCYRGQPGLYALGARLQALTGARRFPADKQRSGARQHLLRCASAWLGDLPKPSNRSSSGAPRQNRENRPSSAQLWTSELRAVLIASERDLLRSLLVNSGIICPTAYLWLGVQTR